MFGAPALDLQPQGQQGFAAEVRRDLKAREPPSIRRAASFTSRADCEVAASLFLSRTFIKGRGGGGEREASHSERTDP